MGMFEQFPYSNFHELNLDWIIDKIKNVLESAVISVNGQTGEVILYQSENVVFPNVNSNQWRMVRTASGHTAGVMFNDDYMYVMYDNTADRVYTINHPPQYPVTSVDGNTGAVRVFPDAGARLPDVTEDYTNIRRQIETNGTQNIVGIEVKQNKAYRMKDQYRYEIYDSDNQPPYPVTSVNGQTGVVMLAIPFTDVDVDDVMFVNPVTGHEWGIGRETADGTATIQIVTDSTKAEAYIDFFDDGGTTYTKKLLTTDDIPSSSGVVSINGQTGVVTIYGDTMPIESGSAYSVKDITDALDTRLGTAEGTITQHGTDIGTLNTNLGLVKSDIAIVEDTNNATHNISNGQYVVWKGRLYKATANISSGAGLSGSNLSAVSNGGLNELNSKTSHLYVYNNTVTTLADLVTLVQSYSNNDNIRANVNSTVVSALSGETTTYAGVVDIIKVSTNNSYFHVFNNYVMAYGNLKLDNGTVNVINNLNRNKIGKDDEFTIPASGSKSFTLPSDGVYMLVGYGSAIAVNNVTFLIGGYTSASRCSVVNLTGQNAVTITATDTNSLSFSASNSNNNSVTLQIIKLA